MGNSLATPKPRELAPWEYPPGTAQKNLKKNFDFPQNPPKTFTSRTHIYMHTLFPSTVHSLLLQPEGLPTPSLQIVGKYGKKCEIEVA
jgi:hypothetical protein